MINSSSIKTILVPTDLSKLANNTLAVAVDIARDYDAEILLVHYLPFSIATGNTAEGSMEIASYLNEQEEIATENLQEIASSPNYQGVSITPIVSHRPAPEHGG